MQKKKRITSYKVREMSFRFSKNITEEEIIEITNLKLNEVYEYEKTSEKIKEKALKINAKYYIEKDHSVYNSKKMIIYIEKPEE